MKVLTTIAAIALLTAACSRMETGIILLKATQSPSAGMTSGLIPLQQACPSLIGNADRYNVHPAKEGPASLMAEREFAAIKTVVYHVEITKPEPGQPSDVGEHCSYEVAQGDTAGLLASKTPCVRLCDAKADAGDDVYVKRL